MKTLLLISHERKHSYHKIKKYMIIKCIQLNYNFSNKKYYSSIPLSLLISYYQICVKCEFLVLV